ncbi:HdeD family acid-resistance protein [Carnobacterium gallinarum]|uniref:HdeD family acid-resistance protein n=1 Tax=Carnobacterium gallinarum TaxID=2749 RepID=UPI000556C62C|nr:DUF308 domain-containing protein [Carnobacterium gallinarum]
MSAKSQNQLILFLTGSLLIGAGTLIMVFNETIFFPLFFLVALAFLIDGLSHLVRFLLQRGQDWKLLQDSVIKLVIGFIIYYLPIVPIHLLMMLFGGYTAIKGFAKFINYRTLRKSRLPGWYQLLVSGIFLLTIGFLLLFSPFFNLDQTLNIFGLYFLMYGFVNLYFFLLNFLERTKIDQFKRKIRISLPSIVEAFIPKMVLKETTTFLKPSTEPNAIPDFIDKKNDQIPNLEIFIHVTEKSFGAIGHLDLYFDGEIISYGNYDEHSFHLFDTMGDGVLMHSSKEEYIPFCIRYSQKTLFGFGISLTDEQLLAVRGALAELKEEAYQWHSKLELALMSGEQATTADYTDYASEVYDQIDAQFYKFHKEPFKSYFVLTSNCVLLADTLLEATGIDLLKQNGILSPGTYLHYLRQEFKKPDSNVVSYEIYN